MKRAVKRAALASALTLACKEAPRPADTLPSRPQPATPESPASPLPLADPLPPALAAALLPPGSITPDLLVDLEPPTDDRPTRVGRPPPPPARYPANVGAIAVDANGDVYVLDDHDVAEVVVQPGGDASAARVLARVPPLPIGRNEELFDLAIAGEHVVFISTLRTFDGSESVWAIRRVPKGGGRAEVLARGECHGGVASEIAIADAHVWFLRSLDVGGASSDGVVARIALAGGGPIDVAHDVEGFYAFAVDERGLVAFVETGEGGTLKRFDRGGGPPTPLVSTDDVMGAVAIGTERIVFTLRHIDADNEITSVAFDGGAREELARANGFLPDLAVDRGIAYVSALPREDDLTAPMQILAVPETGGDVRIAVPALPRGTSWTVRDGTAYWSTETGVASAPVRAIE